MEAAILPERSPTSLKRPLPVDVTEDPGSPSNGNASTTPSPMDSARALNYLSRQASPALSSVTSLSSLSATPPPPTFGLDGSAQTREEAQTGEPAAKKIKLTPAEKELRKAEKEAQKTKREQEKQARDEERRQRNEVKEEKRRERELAQQRKDDEKRKIEEEKAKKERVSYYRTSIERC